MTGRSNTDLNFGSRVEAEMPAIEFSRMAVGKVEYLRHCKGIERRVESAPLYLYADHFLGFDRGRVARPGIDAVLCSRDGSNVH